MEKASTAPAQGVQIITPSDTGWFDPPLRAISVGTAGDVRILDGLGQDVVIPENNLAVGIMHPIQIKRVYATGTTALELVGFV